MEIHWLHPEILEEADRRDAEERLRGLAAEGTDLIDIRVRVKTTLHHQHGAQEVVISALVRGAERVASRTRSDAALALRECLDAFEREIRRLRERRTDGRELRPASPPELGIVDRVFADDGYGFVITDSGDRVYFHRNAVRGGLEFERLEEGQRVGLQLEKGDEGLQATVIRRAPPDASAP